MTEKTERTRVGVLISGRGSNMRSLIEAAVDPAYPAEMAVVISNRPDATGLEYARSHNIPALVIDHKRYASRELFEQALQKALEDHRIEVVCLAGFMRVLTPWLISHWPNRMLNIHPSLLPDFKGLHTHQRALEAGVREHGCTVHLVVPELDSGPVLAQAHVLVHKNDTEASLAARVLEQENILYPKALAEFIHRTLQSDVVGSS